MRKQYKKHKNEQIVKQIKEKRQKGSMTIEAACIMPILLMVIMLLMYLAFFLYNRCIISHKVYQAALRGSAYEEELMENQLERKAFMKKELKDLYGTKLIAGKHYGQEITVGKKDVKIKAHLDMKVPFIQMLKNQGFLNGWKIDIEKKAIILEEVDFIRTCRKLEKLKGEIH